MSEVTYETVELTREAGVATIRLNRPDSLNALNSQLGGELRDPIFEVADDPDVRAVLLTGAGRGFTAGADLRDASPTTTTSGRPDLGAVLREVYNPAILRLRSMDKPAIAAVNGPCVGVGVGFATACDYVLAARSAYFLLAFVNIGLVLDGGTSALVAGRVGFTRAAEFAGLGGRLSAQTALDWGLVNALHEDDELPGAAMGVAQHVAAGAPRAQASIKRMLNEQCFPRLAEALELEATLQSEQGEGVEFPEGVAAFLEKRPAKYA
jgi:2-(1,2-epoxy-1,2-dihydrophenyl)acetyl-CoA isomerase